MTVQSHPDAFLRVERLVKRFGPFQALKGVDLAVAKGEFVCFLGPSGCGKTTLLRAIAGLDPQSEGRIFIGGRDVSNAPPSERDFGIVFQSYALFPNLTIADNVGYGLVNRAMSRAAIQARVGELLELIGLSDQAQKYPVQLSGGQQQRVALARALATSPSLLLLDEPLSALDARVRLRLRDEIRSVQRRLGITTIMVTHDQEEALSMAERIVVMNHGVIEQVGTPQEIYERPQTAFVADFVGRMNLVPASLGAERSIRIGQQSLACEQMPADRQAGAIEVGFRPEAAQIVARKGKAPANALDVVVDEVQFLGSFSRLRCVIPGTELSFHADVQARDVPEPGAEMRAVIPASALRVYPARGAV